MWVWEQASFGKKTSWLIEAGLWYLVLGLFRVMPISWASYIGGRAMRFIGPFLPAHQTALTNISLVFPKMEAASKRQLAMDCWDNLGRIAGEFPHLQELHPYAENGRVVVRGKEHLQQVIDSNKPAVLISGHFANWEVMAAAICLGGLQARVSYRSANNPWIDRSITKIRLAYGIPELSAKGGAGAREMLDAMQEGNSVTFLNDQKFNQGISSKFFGYDLPTAAGPSRLAHRFGAPIIPVSIIRLPKARFEVRFHRPLVSSTNPDKASAIRENVDEINRFLEAQIRTAPNSWFWVHRRWPREFYKKK